MSKIVINFADAAQTTTRRNILGLRAAMNRIFVSSDCVVINRKFIEQAKRTSNVILRSRITGKIIN